MLIALAVLTTCPPPPIPVTTAFNGDYISARYTVGLMRRVAKKRGIPMGDCGISWDLVPLRSVVRVTGIRTGVTRDCVLVDVSQARDRPRHVKARQLELDGPSALAICGKRWYYSRPKDCPVSVVVLSTPEK